MMKLFTISALFILSELSFSKIANIEKESYQKLQNKFKAQKSKVFSLKGKIGGIEKNLTKTNKLFLNKLKEENKIKIEIKKISNQIENFRNLLRGLIVEYNDLKKEVVLNQYLNEDGYEKLVEKNLMQQLLDLKLSDLKILYKKEQKLTKMLLDLNEQYTSILGQEEKLQGVIFELETKKQGLAESYLQEVDRQNFIYNVLGKKEKEIKKLQKYSTLNLLTPPIVKNCKYFEKDKGISIRFAGTRKVLAPGEGKVVYSSKYDILGSIIIIEHKNELRSVLLGDFKITSKVGDIVKNNSIVGLYEKDKSNELYFEVRKESSLMNAKKYVKLN